MAAVATHPFERRVAETQISKSDVNNLIMDYLITEGYPSAAEKFAAEANIQHKGDLTSIQERVKIRDAIYSGNLQQAIELINEINPDLLDLNKKLHFSLLRLQLVELIRASFSSPDKSKTSEAIAFAQYNLAPYAPLDQQYKTDLERAMALLIVPKESWNQQNPPPTSSSSSVPTTGQSNQATQNDFGALAELVDPSLRRKVAKDVNEAILQSQGQRREANIRYLVRARAYFEQMAREKKIDLPEKLNLGLDRDEPATSSNDNNDSNGHNNTAAGGGGGDTEMAENDGAAATSSAAGGGGDAMMTRYTNIPS